MNDFELTVPDLYMFVYHFLFVYLINLTIQNYLPFVIFVPEKTFSLLF